MICQLYAQAIEAYQQGRLVICCDEKTGMQVLERKAPTNPARRAGANGVNMSTSAMVREY